MCLCTFFCLFMKGERQLLNEKVIEEDNIHEYISQNISPNTWIVFPYYYYIKIDCIFEPYVNQKIFHIAFDLQEVNKPKEK